MGKDPFLRQYQPSELKFASEFLTTLLPSLSRDLCKDCVHVLSDRIRSLNPVEGELKTTSPSTCTDMELGETSTVLDDDYDGKSTGTLENGRSSDTHSLGRRNDGGNNIAEPAEEAAPRSALPSRSLSAETGSRQMSQEDELEEGEEQRETGSGSQAADPRL